ncbi:hypothetical protein [Malaciobacter mytili]|uniref:hypothetical protein n=1 Tax=Malaciobacter mytili TaxID=603050 RepID=UPI003A8ABC33
MRFLLSKLKFKYLLIIIVCGLILQLVFGILQVTYIEFPIKKSPNPKASSHFIKAMQYKMVVGYVHNIVDYDNLLMQPFLNLMNKEYEKGKALLPKNSAEDVYWYVILFRGIHGIGGIPDRKDMSLAYKNIYSKEEYEQHYQEIVNKIKRLATDDFNFDVPRITQYKYEFMDNLANEVMYILNDYISIDKKALIKKALINKKYEKDLKEIYTYYINFTNKYLPLANKQSKNKVDHIVTKIRFFSYFLGFRIHQTRQANCDNENYIKLIKNIKLLKQMSLTPTYKNEYFYYESTFNNPIVYGKFKVLEKFCPKLKEEAKEVIKYFNKELEKKYIKEK